MRRGLPTLAAALVLALPALILAPSTRAQDQQKKEPEKKPAQKRTLEDAIARALRTAKKSVDDQKLLRATVVKGTLADDESYLVVCEFGTGDVGIFEGSAEPETDQFFLIEKHNVEVLAEITKRAASR